ncbi:MAG: glycosyltransferase family 2 protein [Salinivirgaceae bacterium]|nr:glycosyltransferase family 2 protein [Salinivirgaceae bacterium]
MVSVCCLVYNHEPFLRECFEGFVMQRTTFPIEILVHDDASTDHSADIIREYTAKYPDIFKPIFQTENQYSKGLSISATYNFPRAQGKYIAMCEGDDYWTDPLKLQKQVEFLEENTDFSLCFHKVKVWKQNEGVLVDDFITKDMPTETDIYELAKGNYIHTPSVLFRSDIRVVDSFQKLGQLGVGDYPLWMLCAQHGRIKKMPDCMAVYRYGSGIWSNGDGYKNSITWIKMLAKLTVVIDDEKTRLILEEQSQKYSQQILKMYKQTNNNYLSVLNSHAFRLGGFLLKPLHWIKTFLKNKE